MSIIKVENLSKSFGTRDILSNVYFEVDYGDRVGLIGENGQGKSTLMKILMGKEDYEGNIIIYGSIGYVSQVIETEDILLKDFFSFDEEQKHKLIINMEKVGLKLDLLEQKVLSLSGGEKTKAQIVKTVVNDPDILFLDEPTNNLDIQAIEWLENYLNNFYGTIICISHDQSFLDNITNKIIEIEDASITQYDGGYSYYVEEKEKRLKRMQKEYEIYSREKKRLQESIKDKVQQNQVSFSSSNNKKNSSEFKVSKAYFGSKSQKASKSAKNLQKRLDRMDVKEKPFEEKRSKLILRVTEELRSKVLITANNIGKRYGEFHVLNNVNFMLERDKKVAIIGKNGSGKTTLINIILGNMLPDVGRLTIAPSVKVGYLSQELSQLDDKKTIIEEVRSKVAVMEEHQIRTMLGCLLIKKDDVLKRIKILSIGEKIKVVFAELLLNGCNLIIMDEPTNHLDIESKNSISEALDTYEGTVLFVSHDRYFIRNIADEIWEIDNGTLNRYDMTYDEFLERKNRFLDGSKNSNDILVLESRLSSISSDLSNALGYEEKVKLEKEYDQISAQIRLLKKEMV